MATTKLPEEGNAINGGLVLQYFRETDPSTKDIPDDILVRYIGETQPDFRQIPEFDKMYRASRKRNLQSQMADAMQSVMTEEQAIGSIGVEQGKEEAKHRGGFTSKPMALALSGVAGAGALASQWAGVIRSPIGHALSFLPGGEVFRLKGIREPITKKVGETGRGISALVGGVAEGMEPGGVMKFGEALTSTAVSSSPSLVAAFFGGLPVATAVAGLQTFGQMYDEGVSTLEGQGVPADEAKRRMFWPSIKSGLFTAATTRVLGGAEKALANVGRGIVTAPGFKSKLASVVKTMFGEGFQEGVDQFHQELVKARSYNPSATWGDVIKQAGMAFALGSVLGGVTATGKAAYESKLEAQQPITEEPTPPPIPTELLDAERAKAQTKLEGYAYTEEAQAAGVTARFEEAQKPVVPPPIPKPEVEYPYVAAIESGLPVSAQALVEQDTLLKATREAKIASGEAVPIPMPLQTETPVVGPSTTAEILGQQQLATGTQSKATTPAPASEAAAAPVTPEAEPVAPPLSPTKQAAVQSELDATFAELDAKLGITPTAEPVPSTPEQPTPPSETPQPQPTAPETQQAPGIVPAAPQPQAAGRPTGGVAPVPAPPPQPAVKKPRVTKQKVAQPPATMVPSKTAIQTEPVQVDTQELLRQSADLKLTKGMMIRAMQNNPELEQNSVFINRVVAVDKLIDEINSKIKKVVPGFTASDSDLGIIPSAYVGNIVDKTKAWFRDLSKAASSIGIKIPIDMVHPYARVPDWDTLVKLGSNPQGFGRILGAGTLLDPRATTDPTISRLNGRAIGVGMVDNFAALWAEINKRFDKSFTVADDGTYARVNGTRGYLSDDIESEMASPGSMPFTKSQREFVRKWTELWNDMVAYGQQMKMRGFVDEEGDSISFNHPYFPRPAIGKRNIPGVITRGVTGAVGKRPGYTFERLFETEAEGVAPAFPDGTPKDSVIYDPSVISRVARTMASFGRNLLDTQLAQDPALGGKTQEKPVYLREGLIHQPGFSGKIYPKDIANKINKAFGQNTHDWVKFLDKLNSISKGAQLTLDLSAPLTQGLPLLFWSIYKRSSIWKNVTVGSINAMFNPDYMSQMLQQPRLAKAARSFVLNGGSLLRLNDYMSGLRKGGLLSKVPYVGGLFEGTGRAFGAFLDLSKLELWDSLSKVAPPEELGRLAETIEYAMLSSRMETIGMNPGKAIGERLLFMAPMYYRGGVNLVAAAAQGGVSGKLAREMIGSYAAGITLMSFAGMLAVGLTPDEIKERFDPTKGKFLKVPVKLSTGETMEIGFGGILLSFVRLLGESYEWLSGKKPLDELGTGPGQNPVLRWIKGKGGPVVQLASEVTTGKDYLGRPISGREMIATKFIPLTVKAALENLKEGRSLASLAADAGPSFFGMNAWPQGMYDMTKRALGEMSKQKYGVSYDQLNIKEMGEITQAVKKEPWYKKQEFSPEQIAQAKQYELERVKTLTDAMPPNVKQAITDYKIEMSAYEPVVSWRGNKVMLMPSQRERLAALMIEEHSKILSIAADRLQYVPEDRRQKYWDDMQIKAKDNARRKYLMETMKRK